MASTSQVAIFQNNSKLNSKFEHRVDLELNSYMLKNLLIILFSNHHFFVESLNYSLSISWSTLILFLQENLAKNFQSKIKF